MVPARAEDAVRPDEERKEIARMQRINRIGARMAICMCIIVGVALAVWLFR